MTDWVLIIAIIVMLIGLFGTFVPFLPGTPLIFLAMTGYGWYEGWHLIDWRFLGIMGMLTAFSLLIDYLAGYLGAKRSGASRAGQWGAVLGGIIGIFIMGPLGIIVGPLLGAITAELIGGQNLTQAVQSGFGTLIGIAGGIIAKFLIAFVMVAAFIAQVW